MTANQIFRGYVRYIGVGAIATAGIFGILKSLRVVAGSFSIAARTFRQGEAGGQERTDRDLPVMTILVGVALVDAGGRRSSSRPWASRSLVALVGLLLTLRLLVLLHLGGGQRHRHHRAQPGLGHDHAHHHRLVGGAAALRRLGDRRACSS